MYSEIEKALKSIDDSIYPPRINEYEIQMILEMRARKKMFGFLMFCSFILLMTSLVFTTLFLPPFFVVSIVFFLLLFIPFIGLACFSLATLLSNKEVI